VAANYSVNINLDTKKARDAIDVLEKRVNNLRRSLNKPIGIESKAVMLQKQQLQLQDRKFATMKITRRLGEQVRKFEEQGLKVDRLRLELRNAARHTDKGRLETARTANKFVTDELKNLEKQAQAKVKNAGLDKQKLRHLNLMIGKKKLELSLIRTAGKFADFNARQRKGIGPNNLLGLPSTEMLKPEQRGIMIRDPNTLGRLNTSQATKDRTTALNFEKKIEDIKKSSLDKSLGLRNNQKLLNHLSEAGLNIQRKNFNLVKQELNQAELLIAAAKREAAVQKDFDDIDKANKKMLIKESSAQGPFSRLSDRQSRDVQGRRTFLNMAPTKGAGQVAMSIDTITKQSEKRLGIEMKLRELEAKGVKTTKIRAKMGELVDAQDKRQFGTIKKLNREIGRAITKEEGKLKVLRLQNKERREANRMTVKESSAQGPFSRLSDRQSRDAQGKRTFLNNPFIGGLARSLPKAMQPTRGFDFGSAMISGGFPLLFGQGPVTAAAGALGGGIGGMFGQMGGFAGGIAATAIVQQIQNTVASVSKLGQAFSTLTPDVEGLTAALGASGTEREKQIQLIKKTEGTQAALAAVTEQLNQQIGEKGVENLKEFGKTTRLISNTFQILGTKMLAALAPLFNLLAKPISEPAKRAERERLARVGGAATDPTLLALQNDLVNVSGSGRSGAKKASDRRAKIRALIEDRKEELAIEGKRLERAKTVDMIEDSRLKKIRQQNTLLQAKIDGNHEEVLLAQELQAKIDEMVEAGAKSEELDKNKIENLLRQNKELEKQAEQAEKIRQEFQQLGQSLATDVADGLKGLIKGTSTLGDMINSVLDKMLDAAINMAMFGNLSGTLGGGGGFFGGLLGMFGGNKKSGNVGMKISGAGQPSLQALTPFGTAGQFVPGLPTTPGLPKAPGLPKVPGFADGGRPLVGRASIVGERGPELFMPDRPGTIVPNHALGGSTSVNVNVDASGSSVEGDGTQAEQLGEAISQAIQAELIQQKRPGGILYS